MQTLHDSLIVDDEASGHEFSATAFNYVATFKFMNQRRMQRQFQGVYPGPSKVLDVLAQLVWLYAVVAMLLASALQSSARQVTIESALLTLAALTAVQYIVQLLRSRLLLLMMYGAVFAHATFFALFNDAGLFEFTRTTLTHPHSRLSQSTTLLVLGIAEAAIVLVYVALYRIYPMVIAREWIDTNKWFGIQRGRRANTITYKALSLHKLLWASRKRFTIEYTGGLDQHFRPHGYGVWKDASYHGEILVGAWEHGIPIGPFTSREHGSGFASQQVRVAYGAYRSEVGTDDMHYRPTFPADQKIRWGVARVECSVAGGFFKFLPRVEHFFNRGNAPQRAAECVSTLRTPLDNVFYRDTETHEIVSDHTVCSTQFRESIEPTTLSTHEKKTARTLRGKEALVFVHGINNSLDDALKLCGQLVARGDFPAEIHPFVFSWASGNFPVPSYWLAKQRAESDEVAAALQAFVASILDAGYTTVHFITHSMGTRVFLNTVERNAFKSLFQNGVTTSSSPTMATMATVSLCSPEFPLARFVAAGGVYDVLRAYCTHITIYGDKWDLALRGSEFANRDTKVCGPLVKSLGCRVDAVVRDVSFPAPKDCVYVSVGAFDTTTTAPSLATINQAAGFRHVAAVAQSNAQPQSEPAPVPVTTPAAPASYGSLLDYAEDDGDSVVAQPLVYLDVDVINTSFADSNVGNRHSYFRVNESIVEDIRDVVLHKRRARGRAGLMRQRGNVFVFLTAPKDVL